MDIWEDRDPTILLILFPFDFVNRHRGRSRSISFHIGRRGPDFEDRGGVVLRLWACKREPSLNKRYPTNPDTQLDTSIMCKT